MCNQCKTKPVYEFTNKRKLCARCFIRWFDKKVLYTIRKFKMVKMSDVINYSKKKDFRSVVLENVLEMFSEKSGVEIRSLRSQINGSEQTLLSSSQKKTVKGKNFINSLDKSRAQRGNLKLAVPTTIDLTANEIVNTLIKGKSKNLERFRPLVSKEIKPLYLFLDEEVLLYAKIKKLKHDKVKKKKTKISDFIDDLEQKHPEIKRAIVNGYLGLVE